MIFKLPKFSIAHLSPVVFFIAIGCTQTPPAETGPSYADLVVTYNAELESLDRLESKREKLAAEYAAAIAPPSDGLGSLGQLEGLVEAAKQLQSEGGIDPTTVDPNKLLDQLAERSTDAGGLAGQLLEGLTGEKPAEQEGEAPEGQVENAEAETTDNGTAALDEIRKKYEPQLAALDKEIDEQKARVQRAKAARDAAEADNAE